MNILAIETSAPLSQIAILRDAGSVSERFFNRHQQSASHSQVLLQMIDEAIKQAELSFSQLDMLAVSRGPGSFTGLRIGTAIAQGFGYAHQLPVMPVSSLTNVAHTFFDLSAPVATDTAVYASIDARMGQLYGAWYYQKDGVPALIGGEHVISPETIDALPYFDAEQGGWRLQSVDALARSEQQGCWYIVGGGDIYFPAIRSDWKMHVSRHEGQVIQPSAEQLARLAARYWQLKIGRQSAGEQLDRHIVETVSAMSLSPVYLRDNVTS